MAAALAPVVINISLLPEIFDLLSKIKVSYLNDKVYVNQTSKFFLNNFNTDYYQLPEITIKDKKVFSYDERASMFVHFRHHIGDDKAYKIEDLERIIGLRIVYLEQYLNEIKHPAFIKRPSNELLIDINSNINVSNETGISLVDGLVYEIMGLCNKYKNKSSLSKEVYRIKSTIKHVDDLVNLFNDLSREEQASSSTKLIQILDDVLVNVKGIIKQIEESSVFEFDIQCKFIESIYNE